MTDSELEELLLHCPVLYHMAEAGSWESIQQHGLLSTSALLDLYHISQEERFAIESCHRPDSVTIRCEGLPLAVVRDQKPMTEGALRRALNGCMTPTEWYRLLNERVFFWLTRERLLRLLMAAAYRGREHDVLELNARAIVADYRQQISLSPMNSGCTRPFPHPRGRHTFRSLPDYPYNERRRMRGVSEAVVELCVYNAVHNVSRYVTRVVRMRGSEEVAIHLR